MASREKNKQLYIDKEALLALNFAKEGLLYPVTHLMCERETKEVNKSGMYKNQSYPCPFLLSPSGKRNAEVLKNAKNGDVLELITDGKKSGSIKVDSVFEIDKQERIHKIMGGDFSSKYVQDIQNRIGNLAVCGDYDLENNDIAIHKQNLDKKIKILNAKKISSVVIRAAPLHRVHEKLMRKALSECDLLVIFLSKPYKDDLIDYDLRYECTKFLVENYLMKEKIVIIPLDDIYLYAGQNNMIMSAILARNFGCTEFLVGENGIGLNVYYINNKAYSIFNSLKGLDISIKIIPEYVYCDICKAIISTRICPHEYDHYVSYNTGSIIEFFRLGILPPTMLVREEISAIILSTLYPDRFKTLDNLCADILSFCDISKIRYERDFYLKLSQLYKITF